MPRVLMVTASFPPSRQIATRRMQRFALGLRDRGWEVTVLCPAPRYMQPVDADTSPPAGIEVLQTQALAPRAWLARRPGAAAGKASGAREVSAPSQPEAGAVGRTLLSKLPKLRRLASTTLDRIEFPDQLAGWLGPALMAVRGRRFDVILASAPPQTALVIGALAAELTDAQLVLDYRDPWLEVMSPDGHYGLDRAFAPWERNLHRRLEDAILARASLVLGVTPRICGWLSARTQAPVHFLPNSLDAMPPLVPADKDQPLRLVYGGSLAYSRSLDPVLMAMRVLRSDANAVQLRLSYAGPHSAQLLEAAQNAGVADQVDVLGELSHARVLALYRGAAAGIVSVSERTDYSYPGKLFEVLAAGCPVLLLGPAQSEAAKLVVQLGAGVVDEGGDAARSAAALQTLLGMPPAPSAALASWQAPVHVAMLDGLLRSCLKKRP